MSHVSHTFSFLKKQALEELLEKLKEQVYYKKCADEFRAEEGTNLGKKVLAIGYDKKRTGNVQWDPFNYDDIVHMLSTMPEAIREIAGERKYLLIVVFWNSSCDVFALKNIRSLTNAPILILTERYSGVEKAGFLEAGADEYIPYPETVQEVEASCKALIRRYTILNQSPGIPMSHVLQGDVFVDKDYRRIYVCGQEINLARREFEVFNLLTSHPERVYTYEQLSSRWGKQKISPLRTASIPVSAGSGGNWKMYLNVHAA